MILTAHRARRIANVLLARRHVAWVSHNAHPREGAERAPIPPVDGAVEAGALAVSRLRSANLPGGDLKWRRLGARFVAARMRQNVCRPGARRTCAFAAERLGLVAGGDEQSGY